MSENTLILNPGRLQCRTRLKSELSNAGRPARPFGKPLSFFSGIKQRDGIYRAKAKASSSSSGHRWRGSCCFQLASNRERRCNLRRAGSTDSSNRSHSMARQEQTGVLCLLRNRNLDPLNGSRTSITLQTYERTCDRTHNPQRCNLFPWLSIPPGGYQYLRAGKISRAAPRRRTNNKQPNRVNSCSILTTVVTHASAQVAGRARRRPDHGGGRSPS